ncbi:uncharacterized protein LOC120940682 [Rana temporaria]|uniref:uncharacterized protein LOC120940682 n=1 Tax=Rana temporaria TaxID=8407 RepID=UPI001AAE12A3|nr:uncharacterized protein LOC120940682 [Rana temporaria]
MAPPIQGSAVRPLILTKDLYKSDGGSLGASETEGGLSCSLSGRPLILCRFKGSADFRSPDVTGSSREPGVDIESRKIKPGPLTGDEVPRFHHQFSSTEGVSPSRKSRKSSFCSEPDSNESLSVSTFCHGSPRSTHGLDSCHSMGKVSFQTPTEEHPTGVVSPRVTGENLLSNIKGKTVPLVVERSFQSHKRSLMGPSLGQTSDNRRKFVGMGSPPGWTDRTRVMDQSGGKEIIKLARAKSHFHGSPGLSTNAEGLSCSNFVGQHYSSGLCDQTRRDQEPGIDGSGQSVTDLGGEKCGLFVSNPPKRIPKSAGRSSEQKESIRSRMESKSGDFQHDLQGMGTSRSRPFCQSAKHESSRLLFSPQRRPGDRHRCSSSSLGLPSVLRLSPLSLDSIGPKEIQRRENRPNSDCSLLAKEVLVRNHTEPGRKTSMEVASQEGPSNAGICVSPRNRQVTSKRLVSEEDILKNKGLSDKVVKTLLSSRKEVTRSIYLKVWKKYNSWCSSKTFQTKSVV